MSAVLQFHNPIAETLLLPLYAKAIESREPNPIIYDQAALDIVAKLNCDLSQFNDKKNTVGTAIRATFLDNKVREFIANHANAIVVNVGCGLDDRAGRIGEFGKKAVFYQVDIKEVIDIRQELLPARDNEVLMVGSILATDWLDTLAQKHPDGAFVFVVEGVLMYFDETDNRAFFETIADGFAQAVLCCDMASGLVARHSDKHATVGKTKARFKFGIDDPKVIEQWHNRLKLIDVKPYGEFADNKRAGVVHWLLMKYVPFLHRCFLLLTFEIA